MSDCCIARAAAETGRIRVKGMEVGISNLDGVFRQVEGKDGEELRQELLRLASVYNYIPKESRDDYADGLLSSYEEWRDGRC